MQFRQMFCQIKVFTIKKKNNCCKKVFFPKKRVHYLCLPTLTKAKSFKNLSIYTYICVALLYFWCLYCKMSVLLAYIHVRNHPHCTGVHNICNTIKLYYIIIINCYWYWIKLNDKVDKITFVLDQCQSWGLRYIFRAR